MGAENFSRFRQAVENNNRRARKAEAIDRLTSEEFEAAYIYFEGKCAYSGEPFPEGHHISIEHIIPIISGGHSMAFNCIPVHDKYNSSKSGYHLLDWWKCQIDSHENSVYNPLRLLKVLNYMVKCLEAINQPDHTVHVLTDNEIDIFLAAHNAELESNLVKNKKRNDFKKISQLEVFMKMDMLRIEELYSVYPDLDSIKLNTAIFFEETIYELTGSIPEEILSAIQKRINALPDIYIDDKKVFKKVMKPEDVKIRKQVLEWAEREKLENKYGIIGYMNFEVLKLQPDVQAFLDERKELIIKKVGVLPTDFNNIVNKVPNILSNLGVEARIDDIATQFKISTQIVDGKSSELYKYIINKPDLLLSGENMEILLRYVEELDIDKRLLRRGVPITTIIDNIEKAAELVDVAELDADIKTQRRVLNKLINGTTGSLLRDANRTFRKLVRGKRKDLSVADEKRNAARWIICISEKYNASEILKTKRINKTKQLYRRMKFNEEGFLVGVNPNAYIVPQIVSMAKLNITREAESELINNVFFVSSIKQGKRADIILRDLGASIRQDEPNISDDELMTKAARWFVFLSETSQVDLNVMFNAKEKERYIGITKRYYPHMKFDDKGNFINQKIPEIDEEGNIIEQETPEIAPEAIGVDYMKIVDSFFNLHGDCYVIKEKRIPKKEVQAKLYKRLSKCKNKKEVKSICIRMLKEISGDIGRRGGGESIGE